MPDSNVPSTEATLQMLQDMLRILLPELIDEEPVFIQRHRKADDE